MGKQNNSNSDADMLKGTYEILFQLWKFCYRLNSTFPNSYVEFLTPNTSQNVTLFRNRVIVDVMS